MKNLLDFAAVKTALEMAIMSSDVDNGTRGAEFKAVCVSSHIAYQEERAQCQKEMAAALRESKLEVYMKLEKELKELPEPTVFLIWKLIQPMKALKGTMIIVQKNVRYTLNMPQVDEVWISSTFMKCDAIQGEETGEMWENPLGGQLPIVNLKLVKGLIDIFKPVHYKGKDVLPKRAMCTLMSLRAQQVSGELTARERTDQDRRYGFDAETV